MTRCANPNCTLPTDWPTPPSLARYCKPCTDEFMRTGSLPVIPKQPAWLTRAMAKPHGLAKAMDRSAA